MLIALYAALAMFVQDIFYVLLTQAEARNRAQLAGALDSFAYLASLVVTVQAVTTLQGHDLGRKVIVLAAITAANYVGAVTGVLIGKRLIKEAGDDSQGKAPSPA